MLLFSITVFSLFLQLTFSLKSPAFLSLKDVTTQSISVQWSLIDGDAEDFLATISPTNEGENTYPENINASFASWTDLIPGKNYSITVIAVRHDGEQSPPAVIDVTTEPMPAYYVRISKFVNPVLTEYSVNGNKTMMFPVYGAVVMWEGPDAGYYDDYHIEINPPHGSVRIPVVLNAGKPVSQPLKKRRIMWDLIPGVKYEFTVRSKCNGILSQPASANERMPSEIPSAIDITNLTPTSVSLSWDHPHRGILDGYVIEVAPPEGEVIEPLIATEKWRTIENLTPGSKYKIDVYSTSFEVLSFQSRTVHIKTPPLTPVGPVLASDITTSSVIIKWQFPGKNLDYYEVIFYPTKRDYGRLRHRIGDPEVQLNFLEPDTEYSLILYSVANKVYSKPLYAKVRTASLITAGTQTTAESFNNNKPATVPNDEPQREHMTTRPTEKSTTTIPNIIEKDTADPYKDIVTNRQTTTKPKPLDHNYSSVSKPTSKSILSTQFNAKQINTKPDPSAVEIVTKAAETTTQETANKLEKKVTTTAQVVAIEVNVTNIPTKVTTVATSKPVSNNFRGLEGGEVLPSPTKQTNSNQIATTKQPAVTAVTNEFKTEAITEEIKDVTTTKPMAENVDTTYDPNEEVIYFEFVHSTPEPDITDIEIEEKPESAVTKSEEISPKLEETTADLINLKPIGTTSIILKPTATKATTLNSTTVESITLKSTETKSTTLTSSTAKPADAKSTTLESITKSTILEATSGAPTSLKSIISNLTTVKPSITQSTTLKVTITKSTTPKSTEKEPTNLKPVATESITLEPIKSETTASESTAESATLATSFQKSTLEPTTAKLNTLESDITDTTALEIITPESKTLEPAVTKSTTSKPTATKSITLKSTTLEAITPEPITLEFVIRKSTTLKPAKKLTTIESTVTEPITMEPTRTTSAPLKPVVIKSTTYKATSLAELNTTESAIAGTFTTKFKALDTATAAFRNLQNDSNDKVTTIPPQFASTILSAGSKLLTTSTSDKATAQKQTSNTHPPTINPNEVPFVSTSIRPRVPNASITKTTPFSGESITTQRGGEITIQTDGNPVPIKDGLTTICKPDNITVIVNKSVIGEYEKKYGPLHLNAQDNELCRGVEYDSYYRYTIAPDILDCGTRLELNETHVNFTNTVSNSKYRSSWLRSLADSSGTVIMGHRLKATPMRFVYMKIWCTFPLDLNVSTHYPFLPQLTMQVINFNVSGRGEFSAVMQLYKTNQYQEAYLTPPTIDATDTLFVGVSLLETEDENANVVIRRCWATPTRNLDHPEKYPIIKQSCPVTGNLDGSIKVYGNGEDSMVKWEGAVFKFIAHKEVWLHCEIKICFGDNCQPNCNRISRKRRAFDESIIAEPKAHILSAGPIVSTKKSQIKATPSTPPASTTSASQESALIPNTMILIVVGVLSVVIIACIIVIICVVARFRRQKAKNNSSKDKNLNKSSAIAPYTESSHGISNSENADDYIERTWPIPTTTTFEPATPNVSHNNSIGLQAPAGPNTVYASPNLAYNLSQSTNMAFNPDSNVTTSTEYQFTFHQQQTL